MKNRKKALQNKRRSSVLAAFIAFVLLFTGTWAWQNIGQRAFSPAYGVIPEIDDAGGRLHNDYERLGGTGTHNKDIFAENFRNEPIFVRVLLREFMSINGDPVVPETTIDNPDGWPIYNSTPNDVNHRFGYAALIGDKGLIWQLGHDDEKIFMPTFNHATVLATSIAPNVSAMYQHLDVHRMTQATGQGVDNIASGFDISSIRDVHDIITDGVQTGTGTTAGGASLEDGTQNFWAIGDTHTAPRLYVDEGGELRLSDPQTHTAQATLTPDAPFNAGATPGVVTFNQWDDADRPTGNFWVLDTETGWFYWASPLQVNQATSLLLTEFTIVDGFEPGDEWEYVIMPHADFVTRDQIDTLAGLGRARDIWIQSLDLSGLEPGDNFPDPDTGTEWRVLYINDDQQALVITEYIPAVLTGQNGIFHTDIGYTLFQEASSQVVLRNWFNNNRNVSSELRGRALDYEFQTSAGVGIPRTSTAYDAITPYGAGIEINRPSGSANSATWELPNNEAHILQRALTRPLPHGVGTPEPFVLSMSETRTYFLNTSAARQTQIEGSDINASWWLRSPSSGSVLLPTGQRHRLVSSTGGINDGASATVASDNGGFRPALWIQID